MKNSSKYSSDKLLKERKPEKLLVYNGWFFSRVRTPNNGKVRQAKHKLHHAMRKALDQESSDTKLYAADDELVQAGVSFFMSQMDSPQTESSC